MDSSASIQRALAARKRVELVLRARTGAALTARIASIAAATGTATAATTTTTIATKGCGAGGSDRRRN